MAYINYKEVGENNENQVLKEPSSVYCLCV